MTESHPAPIVTLLFAVDHDRERQDYPQKVTYLPRNCSTSCRLLEFTCHITWRFQERCSSHGGEAVFSVCSHGFRAAGFEARVTTELLKKYSTHEITRVKMSSGVERTLMGFADVEGCYCRECRVITRLRALMIHARGKFRATKTTLCQKLL